jgi:hypothetical protein
LVNHAGAASSLQNRAFLEIAGLMMESFTARADQTAEPVLRGGAASRN